MPGPHRDLKKDLRMLARAANARVITLHEVAAVLALSPRLATLRMAHLIAGGWARRIRRGAFLLIDVKTKSAEHAFVDSPEALAQALFAPCYIAGWSAAAHWRLGAVKRVAVFVVTARRVQRTSVRMEGHRFHLVHAPRERVEGPGMVKPTYHGAPISDVTRTLVDALCDPSWLGGAIYLSDALTGHRFGDDWDEDYFADVMRIVGTGAAHKRLGMLIELKDLAAVDLERQAKRLRTSGVIDLDPTKPSVGPIRAYWGVRRNADLLGFDIPVDEDIPDDFIEGVDDPDG